MIGPMESVRQVPLFLGNSCALFHSSPSPISFLPLLCLPALILQRCLSFLATTRSSNRLVVLRFSYVLPHFFVSQLCGSCKLTSQSFVFQMLIETPLPQSIRHSSPEMLTFRKPFIPIQLTHRVMAQRAF